MLPNFVPEYKVKIRRQRDYSEHEKHLEDINAEVSVLQILNRISLKDVCLRLI